MTSLSENVHTHNGDTPTLQMPAWMRPGVSKSKSISQDTIDEMTGWFEAILGTDQIVELRALNVDGASGATHVGYFDHEHISDFVTDAIDLSGRASAVYFMLNPLKPELLDRAVNFVKRTGRSAGDEDVLHRRWLLVDVDPQRPSKGSSTDAEKANAEEVIDEVKTHLTSKGWPEPIYADSGNGYHLLYRIELPAEDDGLVQRVLHGLANRFSTSEAKVDTIVYNPARITKLYGTKACKGKDTVERPHRLSKVLHMPTMLNVVSKEQLEGEAADEACSSPAKESKGKKAQNPLPANTSQVNDYIDNELRTPGVAGQGRRKRTLRVARDLVLGFDLSVERALEFLKRFNAASVPPLDDKGLRRILEYFDKKPGKRGHLLAKGDDPKNIALQLVSRRSTPAGRPTLRTYADSIYEWKGSKYTAISKPTSYFCGDIDRIVKQVSSKPVRVTTGLTRDVMMHVENLTGVPDGFMAPGWLIDNPKYAESDLIVAPNGMLHVPDYLKSGVVTLLPADPDLFVQSQLGCDIDPKAGSPREWLTFLGSIFGNDTECIEALQEWFGYCLTYDTSLQKILFMVGPPRSGKGTIGRVLRALVGPESVTGPTLESLGSHFGLAPLLGTRLAIIGDARLSRRSDGDVTLERLLSISGEDILTVDRKNKSQVTARLTTRLMIETNELPSLRDSSNAFSARLILLPLTKSFEGHEDSKLEGRLLLELPGILMWALEGLKRLKANDKFTIPKSGTDELEEMRELASPISSFVADKCVLGNDHSVGKDELYTCYKAWCADCGIEPYKEKFCKDLLTAYRGQIKSVRRWTTGSKRENFFKGVSIWRGIPRPSCPGV